MKIKWQIFATILLLFVASCSKDNDKMDGELIIEDLKVGEGAPVEKYNIVTVNYTGWLTDDTKFDSSLNPGRSPFRFTVGGGQVIKGWDEGIMLLNVGTRAKLIIPPELGYGARGAGGVIPPNAILIFDVELVSIK